MVGLAFFSRARKDRVDALDHAPTHENIKSFLQHQHQTLNKRELILRRMTTDGSPLYPDPIRQVFEDVSEQIFTFNVIKELVKGSVRR